MDVKYLPNLICEKGHVRQATLLASPENATPDEKRLASIVIEHGERLPYFALRRSGRWKLYHAKWERGSIVAVVLHKNLTKAAVEMWLMYRGRSAG